MVTSVNSFLGYSRETTFGTAVTPTVFPCYNGSCSFTTNRRVERLGAIANLTSVDFSPTLIWEITGDISGVLSNPHLFRSLLTSVTTTGSSPPYTHTYSIQNSSTVPSWTIQNHVERVAGCVINSIGITARHGELVTFRAGFISGFKPTKQTLPTSVAPDSSVDFPFVYTHGSITTTDYNVGTVREASFTIEGELDLLRGLGSVNPTQAVVRRVVGRAEITSLFPDTGNTVLDNLLTENTNTANFDLVFSNGGTGSSLRRITLRGSGRHTLTAVNFNNAPHALIELRGTLEITNLTVIAENALSTPI